MAWRKPANLREWLRLLARHKKKGFFPAVTVMIAVVLASSKVPAREYRAEARLQRVSDVPLSGSGSAPTVEQQAVRRELLDELRGSAAVARLIDDLDLAHGEPSDALIRHYQRAIRVTYEARPERAEEIVVSFTHPRRDLPPRAVNRLAENYIASVSQERDPTLTAGLAFFEERAEHFPARVRALEEQAAAFEAQHPGLAADEPQAVRQRLADVRRTAAQLEAELVRLRVLLDEAMRTAEGSVDADPHVAALRQRRDTLREELEGQTVGLGRGEEHPDVVAARTALEAAEAELREAEERAAASVTGRERRRSQAAAAELTQRIGELERRLAAALAEIEQGEALLRNFPAVRAEYLDVRRELDQARAQLNFWENQLRRAGIVLAAGGGQRGMQVTLTQRAPGYAQPSRPTFAGVLTVALLAGLATAALALFLAEAIDSSLHSIDHAADALKLPVLGGVSEIVTPSRRFRRKVVGWALVPALATAALLVLLASAWVMYLNLEEPQRFEALAAQPREYVAQTLTGAQP